MKWVRVVVQPNLRVQASACAHDTHMPHALVTGVDVVCTQDEELKAA